jgi:cytidine deaminase
MKISKALRSKLIEEATQVRKWAYAPYSKYAVGAALLANSGKIYSGVNVENAAYPTGICAERTALFKAISEGERQFDAIAIVTENGGAPCGSCRQVLSEFGLETIVITADVNGKVVQETTLKELLPDAFLPDDLRNASK